MERLTRERIKNKVADSEIIYHRGEEIYFNDDLLCVDSDNRHFFHFRYDGNYGEYDVTIDLTDSQTPYLCDCPYPGEGCKHIVAALLAVGDMLLTEGEPSLPPVGDDVEEEDASLYFSREEIRKQALEEREKRAKSETYTVVPGDMYKDEHLVVTASGRRYSVCLHDPLTGRGHCGCPDFATNRLGTCKHLIFLKNHFAKIKGFKAQVGKENFPFADIFWNSEKNLPCLYVDPVSVDDREVLDLLNSSFDEGGIYKDPDLGSFVPLMERFKGHRRVRIQPEVLKRVQAVLHEQQLEGLRKECQVDYSSIKIPLYPYQREGVAFGLFRRSTLIGDEMGLGKTLQAITLSVLKKEIFGFKNVLVVTLASLKEQWYREIGRFTHESAVIVSGKAEKRRDLYRNNDSFFKITNYEAVLRDISIISKMKPDIIILDEAQRIKNYNTKTADAVKQLPREHAIVLTGTPLENKLEDVYSIVQFLEPALLTPLWEFAANHYMLQKKPKGKIAGYRNLAGLKEILSTLVIRRRKEEVLKDLPETVTNNYYIDLTDKQAKIHAGYMSSLMPILGKKFLTAIDLQRIQMLLLNMRMVCNSTYLIDKKTNISPKLKEFESIIRELVVENSRKVVVFSEWTRMTFLIAKLLSDARIPFVELSGKVPVHKRQKLIDEFTANPECKVFLSTDAGGTGLNLQAADCVVNFELPWNPAKLSQRTGRVNRIGQTSGCVNVINLISKHSIEEKIFSGLQLKRDLFKGVFEDGDDVVDFSNAKKATLLNRLREMMGEEPDEVPAIDREAGEEISEDTPHYLNPRVLNDRVASGKGEDGGVASELETMLAETDVREEIPGNGAHAPGATAPRGAGGEAVTPSSGGDASMERLFEGQSAEKIETVLNSGMEFIGGLLEMATGKKIEKGENREKMLTIDRDTGEVTMKFKLPGI